MNAPAPIQRGGSGRPHLATPGRLLFVALLAATGCATGGSAPESWRLATGQTCHVSKQDSLRVAFSEISDPALLAQALAAIPEVGTASGDTIVVLVSYDSTGVRSHAGVSHPMLSETAVKAMQRVLEAHTPERAGRRRYSTAIMIRSDPPQLLSYTPKVVCPPALLNRNEVRQALEKLGHLVQQRDHSVLVWIRVDPRGVPQEVKVHRSSGDFHADKAFAEVAWKARFAPPLLDARHPVGVWVQVPLSVRGVDPLPPAN